MSHEFDPHASHGVIQNHPHCVYEQYGRYFNVQHQQVDPNTGALLNVPEVVADAVADTPASPAAAAEAPPVLSLSTKAK